jgi:hypothetical protein
MTAVEWLEDQYFKHSGNFLEMKKAFEQAKEIEKQQMIDAWENGYKEFYDGSSTPEEYYNETFKSE